MSDTPAYINGNFMPLSAVTISPLDRGFLFGDGIYEVVPAYGRNFLDLDGHLDRLANCLDAIEIVNPHTHAQWRQILQQLVDECSADDKKVYVQVTRGVQQARDHDFVGDEAASVFAMCTAQKPPSDDAIATGISVNTEQEIR